LLGAVLGLLILSCGSDNPAAPGRGGEAPIDPTLLPPIPIPDTPTSILPAKSEEIPVGLSAPLDDFFPIVEQLERMVDDGTSTFTDENRRLWMVCEARRSLYSCDDQVGDGCYVQERPRFLQKRYWKLVTQQIIDPGASYSQEETIEYGSSTTDTKSQSFSQTISVEVSASAGWGPFSAEVTSKYEQTSTSEEVHSVTFSEKTTTKKVYSVESDPNATIVYALWQLVDVFLLTDSDQVPIHQSDMLGHVSITEVPRVEFPNGNIVYQSVTKFDPPSTTSLAVTD